VREVRIPKGNGRYREIVVPSRHERATLRELLPRLTAAERRFATQCGVAHVAHGFVTGRSPVTNAQAHVGAGWRATITLDLASWFDSVTEAQIAVALSAAGEDPTLAARITYQGRAAQGLPTSPCAANLAAVALDAEIERRLAALDVAYRYTRYADDLTISIASDDWAAIHHVIAEVAAAVAARAWQIAPHKTHVYLARAGWRIVTGVAVGETAIRPTRDLRRRLRAARYAAPESRETRGLAEWAALRPPRGQQRQIRGGVAVPSAPTATAPAPSAPTATAPAPSAPTATAPAPSAPPTVTVPTRVIRRRKEP
jgi:hypothetical protein